MRPGTYVLSRLLRPVCAGVMSLLPAACGTLPQVEVEPAPGGGFAVEIREAQSFRALAISVYNDGKLGCALAEVLGVACEERLRAGTRLTLPPKEHLRAHVERSRQVDKLLRKAHEAARKGKFAKAADLYARAQALAPERAEILYRRGRALARAGRLEEAGPLLEKAARALPAEAGARFAYGDYLRRTGRLAEALEEFEAALEADRFHARASFERARTLAQLGESARARDALRLFLYEFPGDPWSEDAKRMLHDLEEP